MNRGLLMVERMVLESLHGKEKNIKELSVDLGLNVQLLMNTLPLLQSKEMITYRQGIYSLNKEKQNEWIKQINSPYHIKGELKDLFSSLVNHYYVKEGKCKTGLKVRKVWMTPSEESIFNSLIYNLENFLSGLEKKQEKTKDQRVVFFGHSSYQNLVKEHLEAVI